MNKTRLEAFSDGVLAVIITILVLELEIVHTEPLGEQLRQQWPTFLAYLVSFVILSAIWVQHHALLALAREVDRTILLLNLVLLLAVSLVPFAAKAVGAFLKDGGDDARLAVLIYAACMEVAAIAFTAMFAHLLRRGLTDRTFSPGESRTALVRFGVGTVIYPALIVVGLFSPLVALVGYALVVLVYLVERTPSDSRQVKRSSPM